jgi:hypothetical protein
MFRELWPISGNSDCSIDLIRWKMAGTSSVLCLVAEFNVNDVIPLRFPEKASVIYLVTELVVEPCA